MITLRIDVNWPYPWKLTSFLYTALGFRAAKGYLRNYKTVARMVNESHQEVKAYWFFTRKTVLRRELLAFLNDKRNEVRLHIVNDPDGESNNQENLEELTDKKIVCARCTNSQGFSENSCVIGGRAGGQEYGQHLVYSPFTNFVL